MTEEQLKKEYVKLRPLTEKHLKNLYKVQEKDNCSKVKSENKTIKCNICGYETDLEFLHFGRNKRPNEKCPNCYSLKRTRLLWYYLENNTNLFKNNDFRVLHTAPETSIYKKVKQEFGDNYISSDIVKTDFVDEIIDIQNIPYEDNTFDLIVSSHVLEHVPDDYLALKEFYRVLKNDGKVIILIPSLNELKKTFELPQINNSKLRERYYKQYDHRRYYSTNDFYRLLDKVGFETITEDKYFIKDEKIREKYVLANDPLFVATKVCKKENIKQNETSNYCNICDSTVEYVLNKENDKICPTCSSTSNERLLFNQINKNISDNDSVLYINPNKALEKKLQSVVSDYSSLPNNNKSEKNHSIFNWRKKDESQKSDLFSQLKDIKNERYDIVLTTHLLDRSVEDMKLFMELKRIIKKEGKLILKENLDLDLLNKIDEYYIDTPKLRRLFYGNENAYRCYGTDLIEYIKSNGFEVYYENPENQSDNLKLKSRLIKNPVLICTRK